MVLRPLLLLLFASAAGAAEDLAVEATRRDDAVEVRAHALVEASWDTVWGTLTDYNRLASFIPGMRSSRVIEQRGNAATVEQVGEARFLFFSFPIEVTVVSTARPPDTIDIRVLKGSFRRLDGGYRLRQAGGGKIALGWVGLIEPDFPLPPLLGEVVLRANIEDQFLGMVREIERREALRRELKKETAN
ncbi:MAG: SRPBCC family protein [Betaproteobacteria bacterium]